MSIESIKKGLNKNQNDAVFANTKKVMVIAGAGSGKTTVLTRRVARIIEELKVNPENILVLTFTNKAAKEMGDRVSVTADKVENLGNIWLGTFHSVCNKILRANVDLTDLSSGFQILDSGEQVSFIKNVIDFLNKENNANIEEPRKSAKAVAPIINKCKEYGMRPSSEGCEALINNMSKELEFDVLEVYKEYERQRVLANIVDFADILLYVIELFSEFDEIRDFYSKKFKHILVDEFQDTNTIQYNFIFSLLNNDTNLFMVGDDDQLIYGWRGANIENIRGVPENFKNVEIIKLVDNYRSTKTILDAANAVISNNSNRFKKSLVSNKGIGEKIKVFKCDNPDKEAENIAKEIVKIKNEKSLSLNDFCVLYRVNSASRAFEKAFTNHNIKYHLIGSVGFWSRKEIKDVMSYLMLAINPANNVAFDRVINTPTRGLGKKFLESVYAESSKTNNNYYLALKNILNSGSVKGNKYVAISEFVELIEDLKSKILAEVQIPNLVDSVLIKTSYEDQEINKEKDKEVKQERLLNIKELQSVSSSFINENKDEMTDLEAFISYASLQASVDKDISGEGVKLMTVHMAKGLEFPFVFVAGMEDGLFPLKRGGAPLSKMELEEERRLAYVAFTRAKDLLCLSYCTVRFRNSFECSPFIKEIPELYKTVFNMQNNNYGKNFGLGRANPKVLSGGDSELERIKREILKRKNKN